MTFEWNARHGNEPRLPCSLLPFSRKKPRRRNQQRVLWRLGATSSIANQAENGERRYSQMGDYFIMYS
jgi:hypothetical protein